MNLDSSNPPQDMDVFTVSTQKTYCAFRNTCVLHMVEDKFFFLCEKRNKKTGKFFIGMHR